MTGLKPLRLPYQHSQSTG